MKRIYSFYIFLQILFAFILFSCRSVPVYQNVSRIIDSSGVKSSAALVSFFMDNNPSADKAKVLRLASLYIAEGKTEGINSDVAFIQMCLETGFLRFGNLVTPEMNNYCGLGSIDASHPGERFESEQLGVRAHIQHLHAYGTVDKKLVNPLIDNRYKWVNPRGKAPTVFELSGTWAADKMYGTKLDALLEKLSSY